MNRNLAIKTGCDRQNSENEIRERINSASQKTPESIPLINEIENRKQKTTWNGGNIYMLVPTDLNAERQTEAFERNKNQTERSNTEQNGASLHRKADEVKELSKRNEGDTMLVSNDSKSLDNLEPEDSFEGNRNEVIFVVHGENGSNGESSSVKTVKKYVPLIVSVLLICTSGIVIYDITTHKVNFNA